MIAQTNAYLVMCISFPFSVFILLGGTFWLTVVILTIDSSNKDVVVLRSGADSKICFVSTHVESSENKQNFFFSLKINFAIS